MLRVESWVCGVSLMLAASGARAQPTIDVDEEEQDRATLSPSAIGGEPDFSSPDSKKGEIRPRGPARARPGPHHKQRRPPPFERGKRQPPGPKRGHFRFFEPEQERRLLDFMKQHFPAMHTRLIAQRRDDPEMFKHALGRLVPTMINLMAAVKRNPQLGQVMIEDYKLEQDIRDVIRRYHAQATDGPGKESLKEQIRQLLTEQFDKRQVRRELEIEELERRIDQQKKRLAEREKNRASLIDGELFRRLNPDEQW